MEAPVCCDSKIVTAPRAQGMSVLRLEHEWGVPGRNIEKM